MIFKLALNQLHWTRKRLLLLRDERTALVLGEMKRVLKGNQGWGVSGKK